MAFDVGSVIAHVKVDITGFSSGLKQAEKEANIFGDRIQSVANGVQKLAVAGAVAAAGAVALMAKTGIAAAQQYEQQEIAFTTLLKDKDKAIAAIKAIEKDAKETPYNLPDLIKANQLLVSAGVSTEDARGAIKGLGNAIAATGGGTAELNRLSVNLQQIKAVGKASALDVKQFAFAGINMYQMLADATGKNIEQVKEMDVTYDMIIDAFDKASASGGMFEGAMLNQSYSLQGLRSNLEDVVNITLKDVVMQSGLFDAMKKVVSVMVQWVTDVGPQLVAGIQTLMEKVKAATEFYKEHKGIIDGIVLFITAFFIPALIAVGIQMGINLVTSIANATLNIIKFGLEGWKAIAMLVMKAIKLGIATAAFILHTTVTIAQTVAQIALTAATWLFNAALAVLTSPIFLVVAAIVALIAIGVLLYKNWDKVKEVGRVVMDFLAQKWEWLKNKIGELGGAILDAIMWPFNEAKKRIESVVNWIKDKLDFTKRNSPSVVDIVKTGVGKVNEALGDLAFGTTFNANAAGAAVHYGNNQNSSTIVQVSMNGAIIADAFGAGQMGELVGDAIIKRLQQQVRI